MFDHEGLHRTVWANGFGWPTIPVKFATICHYFLTVSGVSTTDVSARLILLEYFWGSTIVGAIAQAFTSDRFGRRGSILIWSAVFTVGTVIQTSTIHSLAQIIIGRFIAGLGVGALSGINICMAGFFMLIRCRKASFLYTMERLRPRHCVARSLCYTRFRSSWGVYKCPFCPSAVLSRTTEFSSVTSLTWHHILSMAQRLGESPSACKSYGVSSFSPAFSSCLSHRKFSFYNLSLSCQIDFGQATSPRHRAGGRSARSHC